MLNTELNVLCDSHLRARYANSRVDSEFFNIWIFSIEIIFQLSGSVMSHNISQIRRGFQANHADVCGSNWPSFVYPAFSVRGLMSTD
jgi:hypothetical protein